MANNRNWTAVGILLAGGASSRMPKDKRFLKFGSTNFLGRSLTLLDQWLNAFEMKLGKRENTGHRIYVSTRSNEGIELIDPALLHSLKSHIDCVPDEESFSGPVAGLKTVFDRISTVTENVVALVVPVDMPQVSLDDCVKLMTAFKSGNNFGALHEVSLLFPMMIPIDDVSRMAVKESKSIAHVLEKVHSKGISIDSNKRLLNVNTQDDYKELKNAIATRRKRLSNSD